jgi:membrane protein DedA with SNARE-associated domain
MSFEQLVSDYGYWAVFIGCLLEGETILVLAGFAAHQGHLSLPLTLAIAFVGGTLGDQVFFWLGRHWGSSLLDRIPNSALRVQRVKALLLRYDAALIVGIRFMYGLRILGPIAIGASGVPSWRFAVFNMLGAAIWAPLVGGLGYLFGHVLGLLLNNIGQMEFAGLVLIVAIAVVIAVVHRLRSRSRG